MSSLTADANAQPAAGSRWPLAIATLAIYVLFAALVYVVQGPEPTLSIDHISYFRLADEIRREWPGGDYYKTINSVRFYSVLLAYMYDLTGEHVKSLKLVLAVLTVAYLLAFHVFMGLLTKSRFERVAFSLASAMFVSFGASIWGMTDFAASLNRTIVIPFIVLLVWFFFRWFHSPWRYAVYPALVLVSLLHLSALHVFLVFAAFEVLDFIFRRRFRLTKDLLYLAIAAVASVAVQVAIELTGAGTSGYITYTLRVAMPSIPITPPKDTRTKERIARDQAETEAAIAAVTGTEVAERPVVVAEAPKTAAKGAGKPATKKDGARPAAEPEAEKRPPQPPSAEDLRRTPVAPDKLSIKQAWDIERFAFPWRNMPPTLATMITIASSFGLILLLAVAGAVAVFRAGVASNIDRAMVAFAGGVLLAAYGLQTVLWLARDWLNIFPVNFEEIRAINMLMIPAVYFAYRLYSLAPAVGRLAPGTVKALILVAFVLQPILMVRSLPASWRERIIEAAIDGGLVKRTDSPRMMYARHFLGLSGANRRFYYSARGAVKWLDTNADPEDMVFTNIDDFIIARAKTRGTFLNIISMDVWDVRRSTWVRSLDSVDRIISSRDTERILQIAREVGAKYAVVTWKVPGALYSDDNYTIVSVQ